MIFLNHQKSAKAAKDYYTQHIAPGDGKYYAQENAQQLKGVWHGRGAEMQQLRGEVNRDDFFKLCDNVSPLTGEQLTARKDADRRVLTDITFTVPKSVSLVCEIGAPDGQGDSKAFEAVRESVRETMALVENAAATRVRKGGEDQNRPTGNIIYAEHVHRTARPVTGKDSRQTVDCDVHVHATVLNATFDPVEKRWKALQLGDVFRDKLRYQSDFHVRLAAKLKDLGYGIEKDGTSFRIAGIDRATVDKFSQRTQVIEAEAERLGINDVAAKGKLGRRTRESKSDQMVSMEELKKEWDSRLTPQERFAIRTAGNGWHKGDRQITPQHAIDYALEHAFERASTVSESRLKAEALMHGVGSIRPEDVEDIAKHPEVISAQWEGQLMCTTKAAKRDEVSMLKYAVEGQRKYGPLVSRGRISQDAFAGLSDEQKKAGLHIVSSLDSVTGMIGKAGVGKTTTMRAVRDAIEKEPGKHVFAFAPSSQASRGVLSREGFKDASTLAALLHDEKLQAKLKGQIIWVDESGQVSAKDMRRLFDVAKRNNNRLILTGDYGQLPSVEAGDAFRLLEKEGGVKMARLTEIRRQTLPGYKKAVEAIAEGSGRSAQKGFDALDRMGWVVEATGEERHRVLVADYRKAQREGRTALIVAPTHAEGEKITEQVRGALRENNELGREHRFVSWKATGWTAAEKSDERNYQPGLTVEFTQNAKGFKRGERAVIVEDKEGLALLKQDGARAPIPVSQKNRFEVYRTREIGIARGDRIRITKNGEAKVEGQAKGARVSNGDIFTVEGFTKDGDIRLENGKLLPKSWGHVTHGIVDTAYSSQGKTVDTVLISVGGESLPAVNQQAYYVAASRARSQAKLYVDSKEDVREAIARTGQRLSAVELTRTPIRPSWRHRFYEGLERNRVGRFLKARAAQIAERWRGREMEAYG